MTPEECIQAALWLYRLAANLRDRAERYPRYRIRDIVQAKANEDRAEQILMLAAWWYANPPALQNGWDTGTGRPEVCGAECIRLAMGVLPLRWERYPEYGPDPKPTTARHHLEHSGLWIDGVRVDP